MEEGLRKYFHTEILDGDNQYSCEKCGKNCDATKVRPSASQKPLLSRYIAVVELASGLAFL